MKPRSEKEALHLALEIAEKIEGLNMLEVDFVLNEVRKVVCMTTYFDPTSEAFAVQAGEFNKAFGANYKPPRKQ